ncbi:MAG: hypothetical protein E7238_03440 [Sarcina sp.]|nr:hypothetical protein [Sarcina sp.]
MDTNINIKKKGLFRLLLCKAGLTTCLVSLMALAPAGMAAESPFCTFLSSKGALPFYGLCLPAEAAADEADPDGTDSVSDEGNPAFEDPATDGDGSELTEGEGFDEGEYYEEDPVIRDWPEDGIALRIPVPDTNLDTLFVHSVGETQFDASLELSEEDYRQYTEVCRAGGFALDEDYTESRDEAWVSLRFYALDSEGYKLQLNYDGEPGAAGNMYLSLKAPIPLKQIQWPDRALGLLVPVPPTTLGVIGGAPEIFLVSYLGNMSKDAWHAYIEACKEAGFDQNISETATTFSSEDSDGIRLTLNYEGANIVYFNLFDPEQKWRSKGLGGRDEDSTGETPSPAEGWTDPGADPEGFGGSGENESGYGGLPGTEESANAGQADSFVESGRAGLPYDPGMDDIADETEFAGLPYDEPAFADLPDQALPLASGAGTDPEAAADLTGPETDTVADTEFIDPSTDPAAEDAPTDFSGDPGTEADLPESTGDTDTETTFTVSSGRPAAETTFTNSAQESGSVADTQADDPLADPSRLSEKDREGPPVQGNTQTLALASSRDSRQTGAGKLVSSTGQAGSENSQPVSGRTKGAPAAFYSKKAGDTESAFRLSAEASRKLKTGLTGEGSADLYDPFKDPALTDSYRLLMQEARLRAAGPSPGSAAVSSGKPSAGSAPENSLAAILAALLAAIAVAAGTVTKRILFKKSLR